MDNGIMHTRIIRTRPMRNRTVRNITVRNGIWLIALCAICGWSPQALSEQTLEQALRGADLILDWRLRHERVDHDAFSRTANALTSRVRLGIDTAAWHDTTLLAEGVWIEELIDHYNSTTNGNTAYPVVADPTGYTTVNRFALTNTSLTGLRLTLGRQRIVLDDARFVGNVGWRQKEQTFDALRAQWSAAAWALDLSYANQVNRVFGPRSPAGRWRGDFVLAQATRTLAPGRLTVFGHHVDTADAAASSSNTVGAKLAGTHPLDRLDVSYAVAWATQRDGGDNPFSYRASYSLLEGGIARGAYNAALGQERLNGNGQRAFTTPLATLHAFLGWADLFLDTPPNGIVDSYLRLGYTRGVSGPFRAISAVVALHRLDAARGGARYGRESDLSLTARAERIVVGLKYARYAARGFGADVDKLWLSMDYAL